MIDSVSIDRRKPEDSGISFGRLRTDAIKLIEQFSGQQWTDYNLHDPGITILEQLLYAITDLAYRTEFDYEDYLAELDGRINLEKLGLHQPAEILSCRATTLLDFRKMILNAVPEVDNIWLQAMASQDSKQPYQGLYQMSVKLSQELVGDALAKVIEKIKHTFYQSRNLCEDLGHFDIVENIDYELCAEIEIDSGYNPAHILARIYFGCAQRISSSVLISGYDQFVDPKPSFDQLFDGPYTENGFFIDRNLPPRQSEFVVSELFSIINAIDAVDHIQALSLSRHGETFPDTIVSKQAGEAFDLKVPNSASAIKVILKTNGRVLPVAFSDFMARYDEINFRYNRSRSTPQDLTLLYPTLEGEFRNLNQYFSIQNQFPANYGINQMGVPASAATETKAKARQLKAYLLIFEQFLTNNLASLSNIRELFSPDSKQLSSYASQSLSNRQINDLDAIYPENPDQIIKQIVAKFDRYHDRKSRLLDTLLGMYGESFNQNSLRHFSDYYSKNEVETVIIENKTAFLESIVKLSRDRGSAIHYQSSNPQPCGLALRVAMLLGMAHQDGYLCTAMREQCLELCGDQTYQQRFSDSAAFALIDSKGGVFDFSQPSLETPSDLLPITEVQSKVADLAPLKVNLLPETLFKNGIYINRYRIARDQSTDQYHLTFMIDDDHHWLLNSYPDKAAAARTANDLRQYLILLNKRSEGLHVVEHLLLRPKDSAFVLTTDDETDFDFYSFKISIVLPLWSKRCDNNEFRLLAEETIRLNTPAHILPKIIWFDLPQMQAFEWLYQQWLEQITETDIDARLVDQAALALARFLNDQHKANLPETVE
ncbi:MAG: hypothetical protein GY806_18420 [Gammaproteobacteria bacterium]|nr:hypothetical protein [Gammaproteobacteria bacterium]